MEKLVRFKVSQYLIIQYRKCHNCTSTSVQGRRHREGGSTHNHIRTTPRWASQPREVPWSTLSRLKRISLQMTGIQQMPKPDVPCCPKTKATRAQLRPLKYLNPTRRPVSVYVVVVWVKSGSLGPNFTHAEAATWITLS